MLIFSLYKHHEYILPEFAKNIMNISSMYLPQSSWIYLYLPWTSWIYLLNICHKQHESICSCHKYESIFLHSHILCELEYLNDFENFIQFDVLNLQTWFVVFFYNKVQFKLIILSRSLVIHVKYFFGMPGSSGHAMISGST